MKALLALQILFRLDLLSMNDWKSKWLFVSRCFWSTVTAFGRWVAGWELEIWVLNAYVGDTVVPTVHWGGGKGERGKEGISRKTHPLERNSVYVYEFWERSSHLFLRRTSLSRAAINHYLFLKSISIMVKTGISRPPLRKLFEIFWFFLSISSQHCESNYSLYDFFRLSTNCSSGITVKW